MTTIQSERSESSPHRMGPADVFFRGEPDENEDEDEDENRRKDKDTDDDEEDDDDEDDEDKSGGYSVSLRADVTG